MIRIYKASKGQLKHREIFDEIKKKLITVNGKKAKLYQQKENWLNIFKQQNNNSESNRKFETTRIPA